MNEFDSILNQLRQCEPVDLRTAMDEDPVRFSRFSCRLDDLLLDWSKCAVSGEIMDRLYALARSVDIEAKREAMFSGKKINNTEGRAVLHTALRAPKGLNLEVDDQDIGQDVQQVLAAMAAFCADIHHGRITGVTGKPFTDVINIGIGGSDLGPAMTVGALAPYHHGPRCHFVSNIDGAHIADTLKACQPETTLIVIASKTFTTIETMTNARTAQKWIIDALGQGAVSHHFAAVSTALDKIDQFGIDRKRVFGFWDWVGGRYSIWSAIGLPLMLAIGAEQFFEFLGGAHAMDSHFKTAPMAENLPVNLALIGYWHRAIQQYPSRAVIPYDQRLARLPAYLQQLDMESNGKGVRANGQKISGSSGPIVWGEPGTNGQHAFFQLLHQGTDIIPVEFIVAARGHEGELAPQHKILLANCFAQSAALMKGRSLEQARMQLVAKGLNSDDVERLAPHREFEGNRPSLTIVYDQLTPYSLGRLIALYEHRVFVEAQLFGINAFDQWGVELGKELATQLLPVVEGQESLEIDTSTRGLIGHVHHLRSQQN